MPEIISPHRWQRILHNQRALFIKRLLLFEERVVLTSVPYRLPEPGDWAPVSGGRSRSRPPRCKLQPPTVPARAARVAVEQATKPRRSAPEPRVSTEAIWRLFEGFAGSMALLALTLVGLLLVRDHLSIETIALVLLLPPLVAALTGRALALVMAAFGALLFNFFFLRPYYTLSIGTGREIAAFLVYATVAMLVAVVAGRLRQARADADRRIRQEQALHDVALDLLTGATHEDVLRAHLQHIADVLGVSAAATVDGRTAIVAGEATPALLRGRAAERALPRGRVRRARAHRDRQRPPIDPCPGAADRHPRAPARRHTGAGDGAQPLTRGSSDRRMGARPRLVRSDARGVACRPPIGWPNPRRAPIRIPEPRRREHRGAPLEEGLR